MSTPTQDPLFLFVFRLPQNMPNRTPEEMQQVLNAWMAWMQSLKTKGALHDVNRLEGNGQLVRGPRGGSVTDGPFAEAKEIVGGYMVVSAPTLADATNLAKDCPALASGGSVEVRPVMPISGQ
ncbi:MAG TPA: YciI family protein [Candidatus Didemnitutus sp.]|nr:YciI family protein [Candidatus Didemnitutus sp.]